MPFRFNPFTDRLDIVDTNSSAGPVVELTGNSGGAVMPDGSGNINIIGSGAISVAGNPGTNTLTISDSGTGITTVNGTTNQITSTNPGGPVVTLSIPSVFIAPGSIEATTSVQADTNFLLPSTDSTHGTLKINGNVFISNPGGASGNTFFGNAGNFTISGNETTGIGWAALATVGACSQNTAVGYSALNALASNNFNTAVGANCLASCTGGSNTAVGASAGATMTTGNTCSYFGNNCGQDCTGSSNTAMGYQAFINSTGSNNTALGYEAMYSGANVLSGAYNCAVGFAAGNALTGAEASNIYIMNSGVAAESNVMRLGTTGSGNGQVNKAFIAGVQGVTPTGTLQTVTINSSGQLGSTSAIPGFTWQTISANQTLAVENGYICTAGAALSLALPAASNVGDVIEITLDGSTSWTVTQGAGQRIRIGSTQTTSGVGGSLASTASGDTIRMVCSVANTKWNVLSLIGNITVV